MKNDTNKVSLDAMLGDLESKTASTKKAWPVTCRRIYCEPA